MAKQAKSFKLNADKQTITLYTNVEQSAAEKTLIEFYLNKGYTPLFDEKKKGKSVDEMRKEMKGTDALTQFEKAYAEKNGFFNACKIYNAWKKENKKYIRKLEI